MFAIAPVTTAAARTRRLLRARLRPNGHKQANGNGHKLPPPPDVDLRDGQEPLARQLPWFEFEARRAHTDYLAETNPTERASKFRIWQQMLETYRKLARDVRSNELEAEASLSRSEAIAAWGEFTKFARGQLDGIPERVSNNRMFRRIDPDAVQELLKEEVGQLLKILANTDPLSD